MEVKRNYAKISGTYKYIKSGKSICLPRAIARTVQLAIGQCKYKLQSTDS